MCAKCGDFSAILGSTIGDFGDFQSANWRFLKILTWQHCFEAYLDSPEFSGKRFNFKTLVYIFKKLLQTCHSLDLVMVTNVTRN